MMIRETVTDTKEKILQTALRLFARNGYEAVSVSMISGELSITKGALYKHYKNKRDIFDKIFERVYQEDLVSAKKYGVPEDVFEKSPEAFRYTSMKQLKNFLEEKFRVWTEDEFTADFRKMLSLERYKNPEMSDLYQKVFTKGPVCYIEDLFREMMKRGVLKKGDPKLLALEFFSPYHFLINMTVCKSEIDDAAQLLTAHIEKFTKEHFKRKGVN